MNYKTQRKVSVGGLDIRVMLIEMCEEESPGGEQNSGEFIAKHLL